MCRGNAIQRFGPTQTIGDVPTVIKGTGLLTTFAVGMVCGLSIWNSHGPPRTQKETSMSIVAMLLFGPLGATSLPSRPVCFSRVEIANILRFKARCKAWPKKCEIEKKRAVTEAVGKSKLKNLILEQQMKKCKVGLLNKCRRSFWTGIGIGASVVSVALIATVVVIIVKGGL